jgi:hypothetical protein
MPRTKGQVASRSGWFRKFFRASTANLRKDATEIRKAWLQDHPGQEWTEKHNNTLANVRSYEKALHKKTKKVRKMANGDGHVEAARPVKSTAGLSYLESLELDIDRCLVGARSLEGKYSDMEIVVRHLRAARNRVILIRGKD